MARGFTIYSKSGCINCVKVKQFLKDKITAFIELDCDEELIDNRDAFLDSMQELAGGKKVTMFPMVFYNGEYIGGYKETMDFTNSLLREFDFCSTDF
jgi:glutaredoxin